MPAQKFYRLVHRPSGIVLARKIKRAETLLQESVGLLGRTRLGSDEGLWLPKTPFVHTLGMRFAIDVIFLDRQRRAVKIAPGLRPGCWLCGSWRASSCVELAAGTLEDLGESPHGATWLLEQDE